jgi:hypothetical protein
MRINTNDYLYLREARDELRVQSMHQQHLAQQLHAGTEQET